MSRFLDHLSLYGNVVGLLIAFLDGIATRSLAFGFASFDCSGRNYPVVANSCRRAIHRFDSANSVIT